MPLGQGIVEVLRAIPPRIEVTGHGPTVRITAGSFDDALHYARERYDAPAVLGYELRHRLWPRVTLTVTTDAGLARSAPPLEQLRQEAAHQGAVEQSPSAVRRRRAGAHRAGAGPHPAGETAGTAEPEAVEPGLSTLEEIFADQERRRLERVRVPEQRRGAD
ncbi:MAG TPA: hypothetical protein VFV40_03930 [Nocardioides sp.]|nr:hypothetical protein [Nocardioides sp.]